MVQLNPVLSRELKERMRGRRSGVVLTLYLSILSLVLYAIYLADRRGQGSFPAVSALSAASVGRGMFEWLIFWVLLLVCFVVPGMTAAAIVGERERQTLIPMQITLLGPRSIVAGKLLASLAYLTLLVVATIPLLGVSFLLGGVTVFEAAKGVGMVLATGVVLASLSLACSSLTRRTQTATILAYGLSAALVVGPFAGYGLEAAATQSGHRLNKAVLVIDPLVATAEAVAGQADTGGPSSPMTALRNLAHSDTGSSVAVSQGASSSVATFVGPGPIGFVPAPGTGFVNGNQVIQLGPGGQGQGGGRPSSYAPWSLLCFALLSMLSIGVASRGLRTPARSDRA